MSRIASLLKIRAGEGRLAALVSLLFACVQAGQGMGDNAASALFLLRFGVNYLPYLFIAAGALTFVVTMAYSAGLGRIEKGRFFMRLLAGSALLLLVEPLEILLDLPFLYPTVWLTMTCLGGILGTFVWNAAGEVCDARQARRLFPLFTSAGILGSVAGNAITGITAKALGTENLLVLYAALLAGAYYLTRRIARSYFLEVRATPRETGTLLVDLRGGYDFVRGSGLVRLAAYSAVLFSVLFFSVTYPFSRAVTAAFQDEAQVAGFLGLFNGVTTAATFLVSLLLANRIFARLGIVNGVMLMPLTYLLSFAIFAARYDLAGASAARFAQLVILGGVAGTAWNAMFNVVPSQKRGQVFAFINGVPSQAGVMLSGVLLIIADRVLTVGQIFLMGGLVALACAALVWRMRRAYAQALVDALRAGRLEVFTPGVNTFAGLQGDAAALGAAVQALGDPKPTTRRLAAQILGRMGVASAGPALVERLADTDGDVRAAAIEALAALGRADSLAAIRPHLDDPEDAVRRQALAALGTFQQSEDGLCEKLAGMLRNDPSAGVRLQAAVTLGRLGSAERALAGLLERLRSAESGERAGVLAAMTELAPSLGRPLDEAPLLDALEDPSPAVRRAAAGALAFARDGAASPALAARLADLDSTVREAAAASLRSHGSGSRAIVLDILHLDGPGVDAALDALPPGDEELFPRLREYAQREIQRARLLRDAAASLPAGGGALGFLHFQLRRQQAASEGRLIKMVGLFGNTQAMELVRKGLSGSQGEHRAAALEALDTIGDRQVAGDIVALLESGATASAPGAALELLIRAGDPWLRVLAICSVPELGLRELVPALQIFRTDPDALVREAAQRSLFRLEVEKPVDTLKTVSILERILLLREVPIFSELSPEDLKHIAEIAQEEWFPKDTCIVRQGEQGSLMYVIVDGTLEVRHSRDGREEVLAQRGPGDFVGEMAIIDSAPRAASLCALTDLRLLTIDDETFRGILRERPEVSFGMLRTLSRRLREIQR
jgi:HEAT repeat protein